MQPFRYVTEPFFWKPFASVIGDWLQTDFTRIHKSIDGGDIQNRPIENFPYAIEQTLTLISPLPPFLSFLQMVQSSTIRKVPPVL